MHTSSCVCLSGSLGWESVSSSSSSVSSGGSNFFLAIYCAIHVLRQLPPLFCTVRGAMSSEEVAELAQAIHSHADALYESWTKGPEAIRRMARMEDTLELLADPGLTPKLEHLVSTFVRRDKAKRQQSSGGGGGATVGSVLNIRQEQSPPQLTSPLLKNVTGSGDTESSVVTNIPISVTTTTNGSPKKPLPKSILAVVQRFEPSPPPSSYSPPSSAVPVNPTPVPPAPTFPALPADPLRLTGVGTVSRNVLWAESNRRHTVREKSFNRHVNPLDNGSVISATTSTSTTEEQRNTRGSISPPKIRHIPILRCDEPASVEIKPISDDLAREEERLFHALRSGQVISTNHLTNNNNINNNLSYEALRASSPLSSSSRVAFAKERIRQSQEHPLTQQRLELQKRLPAPSSTLAAAIALQQGKTKFQPNSEDDHHASNGFVNHARENGRSSWVSSLRFNNGASVADRVQLFEKYPVHIQSTLSSSNTNGSPVITTHTFSSPSITNNVSPSHNNNSANVSIVSVSMAPAKEVSTITSNNNSISIIRKQAQPSSSSTSSAPWRAVENYQVEKFRLK